MRSAVPMIDQRRQWANRVGSVFDTRPRLGYTGKSVWLPRDIETTFAEMLETEGLNICIDGATGTGKSSVALTVLNKFSITHIPVQLTTSMLWADFCKLLINPESNVELALEAEIEGGIEQGLPLGKFRFKFGGKHRKSDSTDMVNNLSKNWNEHDVCQMLAKTGALLLIDDFDKASEDMIKRIAGMCKLLSQSYQSHYSKVIIVGTDDIYRRLCDFDPSLENRLSELSLGTFPDKNTSWAFLSMGFKALGLTHPATDKLVSKIERAECIEAVYEAADGLPKSLNELGREIGRLGFGRTRISPTDIKIACAKMPMNHLKLYQRKEFPEIIKCIEGNLCVRHILQTLYKKGIGKVHYWLDIVDSSGRTFTEAQLDNAISELIQVRFLTRTGKGGEVLFATNPTLAHTLGVLVSNAEKYKLPPHLYGPSGQLKLDLFGKS